MTFSTIVYAWLSSCLALFHAATGAVLVYSSSNYSSKAGIEQNKTPISVSVLLFIFDLSAVMHNGLEKLEHVLWVQCFFSHSCLYVLFFLIFFLQSIFHFAELIFCCFAAITGNFPLSPITFCLILSAPSLVFMRHDVWNIVRYGDSKSSSHKLDWSKDVCFISHYATGVSWYVGDLQARIGWALTPL